jgi:hypothetical protein
MDDIEFADLENRLRACVGRRRPTAPDELLQFIDEVPGRYAPSSRLGLRVRAFTPRLRIGLGFAATAAALVVAVVAGNLLVSLRQGQSGGVDQNAPNSGSGWTWQRGDGKLVGGVGTVANGYVADCMQEGSGGQAPSVFACSSRDGANWSEGIDSGMMSVEGVQRFIPASVAVIGDTYVAIVGTYLGATAATPTPGSSVGSSPTYRLARSTDGTHFQLVDSSQFQNLGLGPVVAESGEFMAIASDSDWNSWVFTSPDGLEWVRSSQLPAGHCTNGPCPTGPAGLFVTVGETGAWRSVDGKSWTAIQLPVATNQLTVYSVPGGGFVALDELQGAASYRILRSADGLHWTVDQGDLSGEPHDLVSAGGLLFVDVIPPSGSDANANPIWQSADGGHTWQPLLDGYGRQVSGTPQAFGDLLAISAPPVYGVTTLASLEWVGGRRP